VDSLPTGSSLRTSLDRSSFSHFTIEEPIFTRADHVEGPFMGRLTFRERTDAGGAAFADDEASGR
jgi:hypothetical protein